MRVRSFVLLSSLFSLLMVVLWSAAQQTVTTAPPLNQRDPQALALLQGSIAAMGRSVPSDSTATGSVTVTAGSLTENGSFTVLTRGTNQTSEQIQTAHGFTLVYSNGGANRVVDATSTPLSFELALSSRSAVFPLILIAGVLNDPDSCFAYIGLDSFEGTEFHHLRYWNSFSSQPKFQFLSFLSQTNIWIDARSGLPKRLSQMQRAGSGSEPSIQVDVDFSDYKTVNGALYPFLVKKSLNGSPWMTFTVERVTFNSGLSDSNFPVQ